MLKELNKAGEWGIKEPGLKKKITDAGLGRTPTVRYSLSYRIRKLTRAKPNLNKTDRQDRKSSVRRASGRVRSRAIIQFGGERSSKDPEIRHSVWHNAGAAELYLFLVSNKNKRAFQTLTLKRKILEAVSIH